MKKNTLFGNIRDYTDFLRHLPILCNLENTNAELINSNFSQKERLKLNDSAIRQMKVLKGDKTLQKLETLNKNLIENEIE